MIWILVAIANGGESWQTAQGFLSSWQGKGLLFGFSFALYYHLCNGIRHLLWDIEIGFSLASVHKSAWVVLLSALVLTVITWIIA
jgi:succinate dehydrogenase / fumarate reductase cytochrome b subunit